MLIGAQSTRRSTFPAKNASGDRVDYEAAVSGGLNLVPTEPALEVLADDCGRVPADGRLLDADEPFERLIEQCADIETAMAESDGRIQFAPEGHRRHTGRLTLDALPTISAANETNLGTAGWY